MADRESTIDRKLDSLGKYTSSNNLTNDVLLFSFHLGLQRPDIMLHS